MRFQYVYKEFLIVINLRDYKSWDKINGTLSVSMLPKVGETDSALYVVLNGSTGNFCLDYSDDEFNDLKAKQRAWSSDSGYYVKIIKTEQIKLIRWWDDYHETLPYNVVQDNIQKFYQALNRYNSKATDDIISFAKEAFIKLRNCIQISDNGQASLRTFMYLLSELPKVFLRIGWDE